MSSKGLLMRAENEQVLQAELKATSQAAGEAIGREDWDRDRWLKTGMPVRRHAA